MTDFGEEDLFERGDYSFWSRLFRPASESLVEAAAVSVGDRVLDVAAGDGNTALTAAEVGADVTAVDPSPSQIARGRRRSEGSTVRWVLARGERLPFADGTFDHALDTFGDNLDEPIAEPALVEMARVVRPDGVFGFTRWTREGFNRDWAELEDRFQTSGGEGSSSPLLGTEPTARAAVAPLADHVEIIRQTLAIMWSSADAFTDALIAQDPYLHDLHPQLSPTRWATFTDELRDWSTSGTTRPQMACGSSSPTSGSSSRRRLIDTAADEERCCFDAPWIRLRQRHRHAPGRVRPPSGQSTAGSVASSDAFRACATQPS